MNQDTNHIASIIRNIEAWGAEKGLHEDAGAQVEKFFEETGELARAHGRGMAWSDGYNEKPSVVLNLDDSSTTKEIREELLDAIGDCAIVLIQIAAAHGLTFEDALEHAWDEIKDREGELISGIFTKDEDLD